MEEEIENETKDLHEQRREIHEEMQEIKKSKRKTRWDLLVGFIIMIVLIVAAVFLRYEFLNNSTGDLLLLIVIFISCTIPIILWYFRPEEADVELVVHDDFKE